MAKGIPGNPPPVPTSSTVSPGKKDITLAIPSECSMWRSNSNSISLRDITLIWLFQRLYKPGNRLNCSSCFGVMEGKYFNNRSDVIPVETVDDMAKQVPGPE